MSEISPKLVLQKIKSIWVTDMAKIQLKSDNINPFGRATASNFSAPKQFLKIVL